MRFCERNVKYLNDDVIERIKRRKLSILFSLSPLFRIVARRNGFGSVDHQWDAIFHVFSMTQYKVSRENSLSFCMHHVKWWLIPSFDRLMLLFERSRKTRRKIIAGIFYITFAKITNKKCRKEFHCKEKKKPTSSIVSRSIQLRWKIFLPPVDFQFVLLFSLLVLRSLHACNTFSISRLLLFLTSLSSIIHSIFFCCIRFGREKPEFFLLLLHSLLTWWLFDIFKDVSMIDVHSTFKCSLHLSWNIE